MGNHPGSEAQILITGGGTNLGNIYAGSMNGTYDGKTQIVLAHVSGTQNGEIYASGALEPYVNQDDWFSTQEPDPPAADGQYTVSGDVEISLTGSDTKQVYGVSENHAGKTFLTIDTDQSYTGIPGISKVGNLTVKGGGTFAPAALDSCTVRLEGASAIDLSQMETPQVHSIVSADSAGNRLILGKEQKLNVTDTITGALTFETLNGRNGKSGIAEYGHTYLELGRAADTAVSFTPTDGQAGMTLERTSSGNGEIWKTSELSGDKPVAVKNVTVKNPVLLANVSNIMSSDKSYYLDVEWQEGTPENGKTLYQVPLTYEVEFNNHIYYSTVGDDGNANVSDLRLAFHPETNQDGVHTITPEFYDDATSSELKLPEPGTYYITIRPFSADEQIEQKVVLIVNKDPDTSGSTATSKETTTTINGLPTAVSMQDELNLTVQTVYTDSSLQGQNVPSAGFSVYINQTPYEVSGITLQNGEAAIKIPVSETNGFHMGENAITDVSDASGTLFFDVKNRCWSEEMCEICSIKTSWLPKVYESYEEVGTLLPELAKELGVSDQVKIVAGAGDNAAAAVGTGTVGDGACNISLGTSGTVFISSDKFGVDENNALHSFDHADGSYHLMGCMLSAASCNKWWMDDIIGTKDYGAEQENITKLGENHVFFLPYLMGERSPHNDPNARGTFIGLTMDTTRADMTQAVLEGVAFALRDSFEVARSLGIHIARTRICGGGAKSPLWKKIVANVLNIPVDIPENEQGPSMGGAMLAAVACGEYPTVRDAAEAIVKLTDTVEPEPELAAKYEERYQKFRKIYPACRDLFLELAK